MSVFFLIILAILVLVIIQLILGGDVVRDIKNIYSDLMDSSVGMFIALIVIFMGVPAILLLLGWFMKALLV